jgi:tRNA pseudouridine55 synthase
MYSALKHQGKKLYELAREGKTVDRPARRITIYAIELLAFDSQQISLDVRCSKGTYIRSLAEDIGHYLGSCGTVTALRRTASGQFNLADAFTIEQLREMDLATLYASRLPVDIPLSHIPAVSVNDDQVLSIKQGQQIDLNSTELGTVRIYSQQCFLGLGEMLINGKLAPKKLFQLDNQAH